MYLYHQVTTTEPAHACLCACVHPRSWVEAERGRRQNLWDKCITTEKLFLKSPCFFVQKDAGFGGKNAF